jgi:hypothetical protein
MDRSRRSDDWKQTNYSSLQAMKSGCIQEQTVIGYESGKDKNPNKFGFSIRLH